MNLHTLQLNVTTSGTPIQVTAQDVDPTQPVTVKAKTSNTGSITIGDSSANALNSGTGWYKLAPGHEITIKGITNTNQLWIDSTVSGEGIEVFVGAEASTRLQTQSTGNAASGSTDSGNPVKVGGVYNSTLPTLANGQRGDVQLDTKGSTHVALYGADQGSGVNAIVDNSDGVAVQGSANRLAAVARSTVFNGSTWDRARGNQEISILTSGARTTTQTSADQTNYNAKGIHVTLDVTTAGTGSITVDIQGKDAVSGKYYSILTGAAVTTVTTNVYKIYPGLTASPNAVANDILPRTWRIVVTANNGNSITYSVGATLIV